MVKYIEVIEDLETCLNFKSTNELKAKENKQLFNYCLMSLKEEFKTDVSTKYLMGFVKGDEKQKSNRVNYMLKQIGLTERKSVMDTFNTYNIETKEKALKDLLKPEIDLNDNIKIFKNVVDKDGNKSISCKYVKMTSHDLNGSKHNCKVGINVYKTPVTRHFNQVVL